MNIKTSELNYWSHSFEWLFILGEFVKSLNDLKNFGN